MKKKYSRILGVTLTLMLVVSLFGFAATPVSAKIAEWGAIGNPSASELYMNLADVEVGPIAVSPDGGTLFAPVITQTVITGVGDYNGTFTFGANVGDIITLTAGAAGATGSWTATPAVTTAGSGATIVGTTFTATAGQTVILTCSGAATIGTYTLTAGSLVTVVLTNVSGVATVTGPGRNALVMSIDGGHYWVATGLVNQPALITAMAISSNFASDGTMYVASGVTVFRSTDKGVSFIALKPVLDSAAVAITAINSIAMWPGTPAYVMIGTDRDVLVLQDSVFQDWRDQELGVGANPAVAVAFAPDFATTNYIWAVRATGVVTTTNSPGAWGTLLANTPVLSAAANACIAFPSDYSSITATYLWVGINSGANTGGVWRVRGLPLPGPSQIVQQYGVPALVPVAAQRDVRTIAASGTMASATILGGLQNAALIVKSLNGGITWPTQQVFKQPTGAAATFVIMAPDFATSNVAYLGTSDGSGPGSGEPAVSASAFQVSRDGGITWNQTGLIDCGFRVITDIAVVSQDTIFMVSDGFSLWKTEDASNRLLSWERILTAGTVTIPANPLTVGGSINLVVTSPDFLTDGVVYATNVAVAPPNVGVMKAIDGGSYFAPMGSPGGAITALHVVDGTFAFAGAAGQFYRTDDGGYSWLQATVPPVGTVMSIAIAPNYAESGHLLVGNNAGTPYLSVDKGVTFAILSGAPSVIRGPVNVYVGFDQTVYTGSGRPGYATVYAGGAAIIERWKAPSPSWESIDLTMPTGVAGAVAADALTITANGAAASGTLTVTSGSVSATITDAAGGTSSLGGIVCAAGGTLTLTLAAGMPAVAFLFDGAADTLTVTATSANSGGLWAITAGAPTAAVSSADPDGDAFAAPAAGPWSLPDMAGTGAAAASAINGLVTSPDGTLYASNALAGSGLERSLDPIIEVPPATNIPTFERVATTPDGYAAATLMGLWLVVDETIDVVGSKNVLFSIDTTGSRGVDRILTYTDTLATEVVLTSPEDGAVFPRVTDVTMEWEELTGALGYNWQIARDDSFRLVQDQGFSTYATDMSDQLRAGQTYYWRVRVDGTPMGPPGLPLLSRWSATQTFTTELGGRIWHPFFNIAGVAPGPGASDVLTMPTFQWNGADWSTSYELLLADNDAFTGATTKTLTTNSWVSDTDLGYSTTWYWKVRALSATSESEWSDVGVFTTMAEPVEPIVIQEVPDIVVEQPDIVIPAPVEVTPVAPAYLLAIIIIGAVLVIFVVVLIVRTRRPI